MGALIPLSKWGSVFASSYLGLGPPVSPSAWGKQGAGILGTLGTPCTWSAPLSSWCRVSCGTSAVKQNESAETLFTVKTWRSGLNWVHWGLTVSLKIRHSALNPCNRFSTAHQCHDVVGQVSSQIRGHETREAGEGDASVILVGTAEILGDRTKKRSVREKTGCQDNESLE